MEGTRPGRALLAASARPRAGILLAGCAVLVAVLGAVFARQNTADRFDHAVDSAVITAFAGHFALTLRLAYPGTTIPAIVLSVIIAVACLITGRLRGAVLAEIKREVLKSGRAWGMLGGAGFAGYMVLLFASIAIWWGLAEVMASGWAALIVTAIWAVIGAVLYTQGRQRMREVDLKPERTAETVSEMPEILKGALRR